MSAMLVFDSARVVDAADYRTCLYEYGPVFIAQWKKSIRFERAEGGGLDSGS